MPGRAFRALTCTIHDNIELFFNGVVTFETSTRLSMSDTDWRIGRVASRFQGGSIRGTIANAVNTFICVTEWLTYMQ